MRCDWEANLIAARAAPSPAARAQALLMLTSAFHRGKRTFRPGSATKRPLAQMFLRRALISSGPDGQVNEMSGSTGDDVRYRPTCGNQAMISLLPRAAQLQPELYCNNSTMMRTEPFNR